MPVNYLGSQYTEGNIEVPSNTSAIIVSTYLGTAVPAINGTALPLRYSMGAEYGYYKIYELYPAPPAGTHSQTSDFGITCWYFEGAGTLRAGGINRTDSLSGTLTIHGTVATTHDDYVLNFTKAIHPSGYISIVLVDGFSSEDTPHASTGTISTYSVKSNSEPGTIKSIFVSTTPLVPTAIGGFMTTF